MDIVVVGDINVDLIFIGLPSLPSLGELKHAKSMRFTLGGSSAIFAHNIARLGASTGFVGKIGKDHLGDFLIETIESAGVDTSRIVRDSALPTGICVSMSFPNDYAMVSYPGIRESFSLDEIDIDYIKQARHLHMSSFYLQPGLQPGTVELFRHAKHAGLTTSLDPDNDPQQTWNGGMHQLLHDVDLFLPNEVEATSIARTVELEAAGKFLAGFGHTTVIKVGAKGVCVFYGDKQIHAPAFAIQPVDTTGAGDSFNAGFIFQHLGGAPLAKCIAWGNACGALSTRALGGTEAFPTASEVEKFLAERTHETAAMGDELPRV
jgi:sugar/nucleoside kinase (ribokinase family)